MQSPTSGYFAYNWFYNSTTGGAPTAPATEPAQALTPTLTGTPSPTAPRHTTAPTPLPNALFEVEYPEKVETGRPEPVSINLFLTEQQTWIATVEKTKYVSELATPEPVGGVGAPIENAFGPEYTGCATAFLAGGAFEITELTPECQPLKQPEITWVWHIKPKSDVALVPQRVDIGIQGQWRLASTGPPEQRQLLLSHIEIEVTRPFTRYINIGSIVSGAIGSGLGIPWIFARIKERREKKGRRRQAQDSATLKRAI